jgi:hypothetical protein
MQWQSGIQRRDRNVIVMGHPQWRLEASIADDAKGAGSQTVPSMHYGANVLSSIKSTRCIPTRRGAQGWVLSAVLAQNLRPPLPGEDRRNGSC